MDSLTVGQLLWAIHISDGVLNTPWLFGGFLGIILLGLWSARNVREEEIPRVALLTVAFFLASSVHLRLGPTSTHLLLNGLVGVVLGRRAPLAILVGITLQAALLSHGGFTTIGLNSCLESLPALMAYGLFRALRHRLWVSSGWFRALLVGLSAFFLALGLVGATSLFFRIHEGGVSLVFDLETLASVLLHPVALGFIVCTLVVAVWVAPRIDASADFALGLLIGVGSVLCTVALAGIVLLIAGADAWQTFVPLVFLAHVPLAAVEGVLLGSIVRFLARVKPELLQPDMPITPITPSVSRAEAEVTSSKT